MANKTLTEILLIDYRWIIVILFLLPASFLYNLFYSIRSRIIFKLHSAPKSHDAKVAAIQRQVRKWKDSGSTSKMCTARPGWQTMSFRKPMYKKSSYQINCNLVDVLEVDTDKRVVRVEPLVTMGQLSETLAAIGWTIAVVPELDDLTVGGLVMGTGVESSSHIFGLFQHICVSYELVLADGSVIKCSETENSDLFYSVPWSYGTLGLLTAAEIKIIPATTYIRLHYEPVIGLHAIVDKFEGASRDTKNNHFVEGLLYSLNEGVIMTGEMVDDSEIESDKVNDIGKWYKPWFFTHVGNILKRGQITYEYVPLRDYYHRHSRALFWEIQDIVPFGNNIIFRYLFGWLLPVKVSLLKLTQTETVKKLYENNHIIQDLLVPTSTMKKCCEEFDRLVNVYPVWLCPFLLPNNPGMLQPAKGMANDLYVDIGVYGVPKNRRFDPVETTRAIEDLVEKCKGFQMLYADTYRSRDEFRRMFDHGLYDKMRQKYGCENAFPEVYGKVNKNVRD
ncbi:delta(24)-sterol reductase-like [Uranotaenia lowii]|uniref:delta(24)-sterol reductase-like n=1 Tax=Uranotaenia lowii TaxID=190385 RepID=UPI002478C2DF|nr:delta(24)-sterol reductase-like [Uranotaenia lowii]